MLLSSSTELNLKELQKRLGDFQNQIKTIADYQQGMEKIAQWGANYFLILLRKQNIFTVPSTKYLLGDIHKKLEILPRHSNQLESILNILCQKKLIYFSQKTYQSNSEIIFDDPKILDEKKLLLESYPKLDAHTNFLHSVLECYIEILRGEANFLTLLFANGSFELINNLYKYNPITTYYNKLMAKIISHIINIMHTQGKAHLNILEIGAGVGSTSEKLLPLLLPLLDTSKIQYYYTDVSPAFLAYAQMEFQQYERSLHFSTLNINLPLDKQGFQKNNYDLILATNVLHNATCIEKTLDELQSILRPSGMLVICEAIEPSDYSTFIYGLSPAWWTFTDPQWRIPSSPLINLTNWKKLFALSSLEFKFSAHGLLEQRGILDHEIIVVEKITPTIGYANASEQMAIEKQQMKKLLAQEE